MEYPEQWIQYGKYFDHLLGPPRCYIRRCLYSSVPLNLKPYLGNGFIATQPASPWLFMDGVFNGKTNESHRACIPSPLCWSVKVLFEPSDGSVNEPHPCEQTWMHFGMGLHLQEIDHNGVKIHSTTFVSRFRSGLLIRFVEAFFTAQSTVDQVKLIPDTPIHLSSPDCEILTTAISDGIAIIGSTRIVESEEFQSETSRFYAYTNVVPEVLAQGFVLTRTAQRRFFIVSLSRTSISDAMEQYTHALALCEGPDRILTEEATLWHQLWLEGGITLLQELSDNENISAGESSDKTTGSITYLPSVLNAAQYSLLTCLPTHVSCYPTQCEFFGLCPTGLARGNEEDDYMGHVFWDMEIWMLPWLNLFHPKMCRLALDYRYFMLPAARYLALMDGRIGARYPWESAFTGVETTPWQLAANNQIHNTAAVSFAVQQWLLSHLPDSVCPIDASQPISSVNSHSHNSEWSHEVETVNRWFIERGLVLLEEIARFWNSRIQYSTEKQSFEILDVMPPDEYTHCCRNSAYTNAIASMALAAPAKFSRRHNHPLNTDYLEWESRAPQLWMPRDFKHELMLEHEDYVLGTCVKQADVVLLTHPLRFEQPETWKRHMVDYYAGVTDLNGPAMTWSIFSICALELNEYAKAADYFTRCLLHVKGPFLSWTETREGSGAANFLTGAGGFLQSLVHGYCGVHVQSVPHRTLSSQCSDPKHTVAVLKISPPRTAIPDCPNTLVWLRGIHFQGRRLNLKFSPSRYILGIQLVHGLPLCLGWKSPSGWLFDTTLSSSDSVVWRDYQPLCVVSKHLVDQTKS